MNYFCCDQLRRPLLKASELNGIDFIEVLDHDAADEAERQRTLFVHLINPLTLPLKEANVRIEGGERILGIVVTRVGSAVGSDLLTVEVDQPGDFSFYTLRLVAALNTDEPPAGFDLLFSSVEFSFKVECPADFDCQVRRVCPPPIVPRPDIDYLAKDYATFRRLMLDRMSVLLPQWQERNAADLGVTLVELLAYVGDHLSYQQDAVATEAYLGTARRRVSVRRHARLVDYFMHDGSNARAWVQVRVAGPDHVILPRSTQLLSRVADQPQRLAGSQLDAALRKDPVVFETMADALLFSAHNEFQFYTWGNARCCLPRGATRATFADNLKNRLRLRPGDVLVFEEKIGPVTGLEGDADPRRRHAVRLTRVTPEALSVTNADLREIDRTPSVARFDSLMNPPRPVVEIEWAAEDAMPFALCLSSVTDQEHGAKFHEAVSVAHGNIVLADHGRTIVDEAIGGVPASARFRAPIPSGDRCGEQERFALPERFRPTLNEFPLTQAAPLGSPKSATAALTWTMRELLPVVMLTGKLNDERSRWRPRHDLLASDGNAREFVVESEHDMTVRLRFGDGDHGWRPESEMEFTATYRVGNGAAGNVGADALYHVVSGDAAIVSVRNPMAAVGGVEPETVEAVRQRAPNAFRTQERAVTEMDYAQIAERDIRVQRAAAALRWTGSWHTMFVTVDRRGGRELDLALENELLSHVDRFRMAGHDVEINGPRFVSLELAMHVCVQADYFRSEVKRALLELFSSDVLPDGSVGLFHPDRFTFGQAVYLSPLYAAAQSTPGVASVHVATFKRRSSTDFSGVDLGVLNLGRFEIAQLDNDPNFPERGVFRLTMGGGK